MDALQASDPVLLVILILAVISDLRYMKISNRLIFVGIVLALAIRIWGNGWSDIGNFLWNISFPVIVLYLFYLVGAMGAGDIKLFSVVGGFFNFKELVLCMGISLVMGALFSLGKMIFSGTFFSGITEGVTYLSCYLKGGRETYRRDLAHKANLIHFSPAILAGAVLARLYFVFM